MTDTFWAFVGLVLFLALLVYFEVPEMVLRHLDTRAKRIKDELDEALRLREEAQEVLAEYQRKHAEAEKDAQEIIAAAKREVEAVISEARIKAEEYVKNRNKLAEQKIAQAEADAIRMVSSSAIDLAVSAARVLIEKELDSHKANELIKESLVQESLTKMKTYLN
ncbi:ATP synthase subunit b [Bartonella henselae]|uniref:ATP synthase subunit b 2 n=2 Tax=Bartonella henselae TaxID=38323 RepID=ATPF2_BARHE|nr:F0F1 ATP synthase subunit B [Bartonella henselae]Q6G5K9.1 RecName: Full=ATP synthase subunit b 2; AltName: Full=ATP synthase F(0) sector subunit b 2; AltName: Full=ATPase subunit I 2; AltName: Full=F-type ATPase subunit b 2; Short=F-ATPase subunit b 2 [Bartonella henselae str. Houston-1]ATP12026.1 ATP synthase subunit b 2 [Bartonella henselae]ETS07808.1 ATP synthase subunit B 2 [Bartonella henselae JK 42]ETS10027.1 ATP synthase subunit B 2 [Bartonella henselae JK 50]ETS10537.1 ATP synthase 